MILGSGSEEGREEETRGGVGKREGRVPVSLYMCFCCVCGQMVRG